MARRPNTSCVMIDDQMPTDPKVIALTSAAFRLWIECLCYCHRACTDGFIHEAVWQRMRTRHARQQLLNAGLVEMAHAGVKVARYLDYQWSREQIEKRRQQNRAAGKASAAKRTGVERAVERTVERALNNPSTERSTPPAQNSMYIDNPPTPRAGAQRNAGTSAASNGTRPKANDRPAQIGSDDYWRKVYGPEWRERMARQPDPDIATKGAAAARAALNTRKENPQ